MTSNSNWWWESIHLKTLCHRHEYLTCWLNLSFFPLIVSQAKKMIFFYKKTKRLNEIFETFIIFRTYDFKHARHFWKFQTWFCSLFLNLTIWISKINMFMVFGKTFLYYKNTYFLQIDWMKAISLEIICFKHVFH